MSASYGSCELETRASDALSLETLAKQGNAQGMTWINSAGDAGGADCYDPRGRSQGLNPGLSVDLPGEYPGGDRPGRHGVCSDVTPRNLLEYGQRREPGLGALLHSGDGVER